VGGGFSGTMVAAHLLREAAAPLEISLIERRPVLGEGLAYSTTLGSHVLNVPAHKMGAFPEAIDDFQRWLRALEPEFGEFAPHGFVPRIWYGTYLRSILAEAEQAAPEGVRVRRIVDTAESVEVDRSGVTIGLASGDHVRADQVVLAFGNLPAGDPPLETGALRDQPAYLADPWDTEAVRAIPADADVLLIGTGLTMVDWAFSLGRQGHRGTIHAVSRRGLVPRAHGPAGYGPGHHPTGVGVHHPDVGTEGEGQHRPRRVGAHAGKGQEPVQIGRDPASVVGHHCQRRPVQVPGPPVVAEALPDPEHLTQRCGGTGRRCREPVEERPIGGYHAGQLGLLGHHLADQNGPGVTGRTPRELGSPRIGPGRGAPRFDAPADGLELPPFPDHRRAGERTGADGGRAGEDAQSQMSSP